MMAKKSRGAIATIDGDSDWMAGHDLRTIEEAHKVVHDKERMSAVKRYAKKQQEALARITRLKDKSI